MNLLDRLFPKPHLHIWKVTSADQIQVVEKNAWTGEISTIPSGYYTDIVLVCTSCGEVSGKRLRGHHTLESLQAAGER